LYNKHLIELTASTSCSAREMTNPRVH